MQNTTESGKTTDLIYQGPLIGMRSTRPKSDRGETSAKTPTTTNKQ
jgi:hypothetical protein